MSGVTVRLRVEVEVEVGTWSEKTNFDELEEQVTREGIQIIRSRLASAEHKCRIVGPMSLSFVVFEKEVR